MLTALENTIEELRELSGEPLMARHNALARLVQRSSYMYPMSTRKLLLELTTDEEVNPEYIRTACVAYLDERPSRDYKPFLEDIVRYNKGNFEPLLDWFHDTRYVDTAMNVFKDALNRDTLLVSQAAEWIIEGKVNKPAVEFTLNEGDSDSEVVTKYLKAVGKDKDNELSVLLAMTSSAVSSIPTENRSYDKMADERLDVRPSFLLASKLVGFHHNDTFGAVMKRYRQFYRPLRTVLQANVWGGARPTGFFCTRW